MDSGINIFDEEWLDYSFHGLDDENFYHGFEIVDSFPIALLTSEKTYEVSNMHDVAFDFTLEARRKLKTKMINTKRNAKTKAIVSCLWPLNLLVL